MKFEPLPETQRQTAATRLAPRCVSAIYSTCSHTANRTGSVDSSFASQGQTTTYLSSSILLQTKGEASGYHFIVTSHRLVIFSTLTSALQPLEHLFNRIEPGHIISFSHRRSA